MRIKICGVTRMADAQLAAELGADAIGLNFYPRSPRRISAIAAEAMARSLPPGVDPVALFVNEPLDRIGEALRQTTSIKTIQWHTDARAPLPALPFRVVVAFQVRAHADLSALTDYLKACRTAGAMPGGILVDAHVPGLYGGTGRTAPWELLEGFRPEVPLILAGGLTPENVALAIQTVQPAAVDVASGVEEAPGKKDKEKMKRFIGAALEAFARLA